MALLLHYYITYRCNCACHFCDIWQSPDYDRCLFAVKSVVHENLLAARKMGVRFVDFTGGEPLLHNDLPEMLQSAQRAGLKTSITTNCLLYPQKAQQLAGLVDFLHFSLDALDPVKHNNIRGKNAFEQVMQSIDKALSIGEHPDLLFTVTRDNIDQLDPIAQFAACKGLILVVNPVFSHKQQHSLDKSFLKQLEHYKHRPYIYVNTAFHKLRGKGGNNITAPRCRVVDSTIVISPDDHVLLPCFHFYTDKIPIAGNLQKVYKSSRVGEFKKQQGRFDFCRGCVLNCYFDPSFNYKADMYLFKSLAAKTKYAFDKYIRYKWDNKRGTLDDQPAAQAAKIIMKNAG